MWGGTDTNNAIKVLHKLLKQMRWFLSLLTRLLAGLAWFKGENLDQVNILLDKVRPIATEKNATLAQLFLRWKIEQPGLAVALAGARDAKQAIENAVVMQISLSAERSP